MKIRTIALPLLFCINLMSYSQLIVEGQKAGTFKLEGKWQSLNKSETVLEFTDQGEYLAYKNGEVFFNFIYKIEELEGGLFTLEIYTPELDEINDKFIGRTTEPQRATIQIVNQDRIRIYIWKHKEILDIADEYHRTDDLDSFNKLIKKAIRESK